MVVVRHSLGFVIGADSTPVTANVARRGGWMRSDG